jgi:hypothetical protein
VRRYIRNLHPNLALSIQPKRRETRENHLQQGCRRTISIFHSSHWKNCICRER